MTNQSFRDNINRNKSITEDENNNISKAIYFNILSLTITNSSTSN